MTPTPILATLLRSWVPLGEVKPWARACTAAGDKLSASALQAQATGERRPTPETFLAVGKAQARPAAEVSLAVALACGDEHAAGWWCAVQGPPEGRAVAVLRALGMEREAGAVARLAKAEQSAARGAFRDQGQVAFADEIGGWRNAQPGIVEVAAPHWDVWSDQVVAVYSWPDRSSLRIEAGASGFAVYPSEDPGRVYRGGSLVQAVARANGGGP